MSSIVSVTPLRSRTMRARNCSWCLTACIMRMSASRLQFHKQMEEPQYSELGDALANVRFGILRRRISASAMQHRHPGRQLISVSGVDAQGMLEDCPDLPQGDYVLRELATDERYQLSETEYPFTSASPEDVSMITIALGDAVNVLKRGSIELIKADAEDGSLLEGARFALYADAALQDLVMKGESGPDGRSCLTIWNSAIIGSWRNRRPYGYARTDDIYHVQSAMIISSCSCAWRMRRS